MSGPHKKYKKGWIYAGDYGGFHSKATKIQSAWRRLRAMRKMRKLRHALNVAAYYQRHPNLVRRSTVLAAGAGTPMIATEQRGPNRLTTPSGIPPGHANMRQVDVYNQHIAAMRAQQNQNPHWVGRRVRDPNITQQSMEDFITRHGGPPADIAFRRARAAGQGYASLIEGAIQRDMKDFI